MKESLAGAHGKNNPSVFATSAIIAVICLFLIPCGAFAQGRGSSSRLSHESEKAAQVRALNNSVLQLHGQMQESSSGAAGLRAQASSVLAQRAVALEALIQEDSRGALSFAFSPELLADLAVKFPDSSARLERHVTVRGPLEHWVEDGPDLKTSRSYYRMKVGQQALTLHFTGPEPSLQTGWQLEATGVVVGREMAVATATGVPSGNGFFTAPGVDSPFRSQRLRMASWFLFFAVFLFLLRFGTRLGLYRQVAHGSIRRLTALAITGLVILSAPLDVAAQTTSCSTTGVQNIAVLLVDFQDVANSLTPQQVHDIFFDTTTGHSLNGYWQEASYGQTSAAGSVFGPFTIGASSTYNCTNIAQIFYDVAAAATAAGVNLGNYTRIDIVFPGLSCGWAGITSTGSAGAGCAVWNTPSGTFTASVSYLISSYLATRDKGVILAAHENGHQLGLDHAGTINDQPTAILGPVTSPGTEGEFNDFFSVMGAWTLATYSAQHKSEILNWMASGPNYQLVQSSGTYTLQPIETNPPGLQGLQVQRGSSNPGDYLWIEYRQPIGNYDSTIGFMNFSGALIHYADSTVGKHTFVLDFTASDVGSWYNTVLAPGQTWTDPYSNVSISVVSATAAGLTLSVNYGAVACTSAAPGAVVSPLDPSIYPGQTASYSLAITNNDSSGCSSTTINLGSTEPSGWSTAFSSPSVTLAPGQTASVTLGKGAPSGTAAGTYAVTLSASSSTASSSSTANATVMTPPLLGVSLSVAAASYTRPSSVSISATVTNGGTPASGASVTFTLKAPNGNTTTQSTTTNSSGTAMWNFKLNNRSQTGTYSVSSQATLSSGSRKSLSTQSATSNTVSFTVQ